MQPMGHYFKPQLLALSVGVSLSAAVTSILLSPHLYSAGAGGGQHNSTILLGSGVALAASVLVLVLLALFLRAGKRVDSQPEKSFLRSLGGLLVLVFLLVVAALIISALYGLLAVLITALLGSKLAFSQTKGIINLATTLITLAVTPFLLNIVFTYSIEEQGILPAIGNGIKISKGRYVKFLILVAAGTALGWLITLPFRYFASTLPFQIMEAILVAIVGMFVLIVALTFYKETSKEVDS